MTSDSRKQFEEWAKSEGIDCATSESGHFKMFATEKQWQGWSARDSEVERLREDAERYRWLCEQDHNNRLFIASGGVGTWGECGHSSFGGFKDLADAAIDRARGLSSQVKESGT